MAEEMQRLAGGPEAAALDAIQANALSQLAAIDAGVQALEAHRMRLLAALGHLAVERAGGPSSERIAMEVRSVAAEVGLQARVADRTVERQISDAMLLVDTWPVVVEAYAAGRIGRGHVRAITEAGGVLASSSVTHEQRAAFETAMVALAETTTPARLGRVARREADAHLSEPLVVRHRAAREERRVRVTEVDDGMAWFATLMPTVLARGAEHRLRAGARAKSKDDPRTIDQWMADACCELLLTGAGAPTDGASDGSGLPPAGAEARQVAGSATSGLLGTIAPVVQITIPATTITGADDAPGRLDGLQPVDADTARILASAAATWQRLLTDPIRGTVVEVDTYAPTAAQRRLLVARDQHCRFPGCGATARDDDADHTIAWEEGGTTSLGNLAHLCRRHHTLKHATAWTVRQPVPGELQWRSPLGRTYVDRPPPTGPTFAEAPPPPLERATPSVATAPSVSTAWGATDPDHGAPF